MPGIVWSLKRVLGFKGHPIKEGNKDEITGKGGSAMKVIGNKLSRGFSQIKGANLSKKGEHQAIQERWKRNNGSDGFLPKLVTYL